MTRGDRKRERQRLVDARTERERAAFAAAVPFTREELVGLLERLSRLEPAVEPFGHTRAWAAERGFDWEPIARAFAGWEITSDRELLLEAKPYDLFGPTPRRLAWMPIERERLEALFGYIDEQAQAGATCDDTPRLTAGWLAGQGLPVPETLAALRSLGAHCDCEMANVESEWIYPPPLQLVPSPPPKPKPAGPKPTEYRDGALTFPIPRKPWYLRTKTDHKGASLVLQFGQGTFKPELRILAPKKPRDEQAWCRDRWLEMRVDGDVLLLGETNADLRDRVRGEWEEHGREIVGGETVEHGGIRGRCYISTSGRRPIDAGWYLLDLPGGFRVVELDAGLGVWDPFHREAKKVLATLSPV